jgi:hypothetical protein
MRLFLAVEKVNEMLFEAGIKLRFFWAEINNAIQA